MLIAYIPAIVMVLGLLVFALSEKPKVTELGCWCFVVGLFWTLAVLAGRTVRLF